MYTVPKITVKITKWWTKIGSWESYWKYYFIFVWRERLILVCVHVEVGRQLCVLLFLILFLINENVKVFLIFIKSWGGNVMAVWIFLNYIVPLVGTLRALGILNVTFNRTASFL